MSGLLKSTSKKDELVVSNGDNEDENDEEEEIANSSEDDSEWDSSTALISGNLCLGTDATTSPSFEMKPLKSRRAVGENASYNLVYIKSLQTCILDHMAANFADYPVDFSSLCEEHAEYIVAHLSTTLPLQTATQAIPYESYWLQRCKAELGKWFVGREKSQHGDSYKRMFFECYLSQQLTSFIPHVSDLETLVQKFQMAGSLVKSLEVEHMLVAVEGVALREMDEMWEGKQQYAHVNLGILGAYLPQLESLKLKYRVSDCALNFDWSMFYCSSRDMHNLCVFTSHTPLLRKLSITHSRLDDVKVKVLVPSLTSLEAFTSLNLSHNCLADDSARFIARFLITDPPLQHLNLSDNRICSEGAMALFYSLSHNTHLHSLNLNLNLIDNVTAHMLVSMATKNTTLHTLDLSANNCDNSFCHVLGQGISSFGGLKIIDLSSNILITEEGLKSLLEGLGSNPGVLQVRLMGTGVQDDMLECLDSPPNSHKSMMKKTV